MKERTNEWQGGMAEEGEKWRKKNGDHVKNNTYTLNYILCYTIHTHIWYNCGMYAVLCKMRQMFGMIFPNWNRPKNICMRFHSISTPMKSPKKSFFLSQHGITLFYMCTISNVSNWRTLVSFIIARLFQCGVWYTYHTHCNSKNLIHRNSSALRVYLSIFHEQ